MTTSRKFVRNGLAAVALAMLPVAALAQDAKSLYDQSLVEGNSCKKMQLACQAAKLDPKKKDYSDTCARFQTSTNRSDEQFRVKAIDSLSKNDFAGASRWANGFVCSADIKQSLLNQIADAQKGSAPPPPVQQTPVKTDPSPTLLAEARGAYQKGDFDAALGAARQVTDPNLKPIADDIVGHITSYRSAVSAAHQAESSHDYAGAINNWRTAQGINANGPESPATNIARLEPLAHAPTPVQQTPPAQTPPVQVAKNNPPPPPPNTKNQPPPIDINAEVGKLMEEEHKQESANNLAAAVRAYDAILRLQATNATAQAGKAALMARINSDPAEQAKALAQAIRDFYGSKYADAEDGLRAYLDAPTAKSKGAAYFYLGATRLYEKILSSSGQKADAAVASAEVQRPFKDAHAAGYRPVEKFVSPVVMRAWRTAQ